MRQDADGRPPAVRAREAQADVHAAALFAAKTSSVAKVDLFAWSWGCVVAGMYAGEHQELVRRLILFAPVYDKKWPTRHKTTDAWRTIEKKEFYKYFDEAKEEKEVLDQFVKALFRFTEGDTLRLPNGPYRDIYGKDSPIWKAAAVRAPTLIVRGDADRASREQHAYQLFSDLTSAAVRRYVVIGGGGHFIFRRKNHPQLQNIVASFLTEQF